MSALWSYDMVCAGFSRPKHYATIRHFQHETPDSPTHASMHLHICVIFHISRENSTLQRRHGRTVSTRIKKEMESHEMRSAISV